MGNQGRSLGGASKISFVQQGIVTQNEFAKLLMMGSGGRIELAAPLTDDEPGLRGSRTWSLRDCPGSAGQERDGAGAIERQRPLSAGPLRGPGQPPGERSRVLVFPGLFQSGHHTVRGSNLSRALGVSPRTRDPEEEGRRVAVHLSGQHGARLA